LNQNYFQLKGKVALITGASSGLGVHFARILSAEGAVVVLAARREDKLAEEAAAIKSAGGQVHTLSLDVTRVESVTAAFEWLNNEFGAIDILINNAGVASAPTKFLQTGESDWSWVMDTNIDGAWRVAKAAAESMIAGERAGAIVNIASIYGLKTGALKVAYNVSKAGVVQLTKSMAVELCRHNIRVNALCPGWFKTELNDEYFNTENGRRYVAGIPAKRLGALEDLTVPLLMLASNSAGAYMTGSCVTVDGGIAESPI
jgi:NAD(P)-dependent dehydrogenase (short-subunit alcohol dehydrogenase family)